MGKPLDDREVVYCWLTKILLQFNIPIQDADGGLAGYNHSAVMFYQLQDVNRAPLADKQEKVSIKLTDNPITVAEMIDIAKDAENNQKLKAAIAAYKLKRSGYKP